MPLTQRQADVLRLIAGNRSEESYLAGATVLHRHTTSSRFSMDVDLFHDLQERIAQSAEQDAETLRCAGYDVSWVQQLPGFFRAVVSLKKRQLKMEWAQDSAFRFFPLQQDAFCGYRLHDADAATNKLLALAGRSEVRDFVDVLELHETYLPLGALVWAACGKDPGFTPGFLLDQAARHVAYTQVDVSRLQLREPLDLVELKEKWIRASEDAREIVKTLPPEEMGCFYLNDEGYPVNPDPASPEFERRIRHFGCVRGSWPLTFDSSRITNKE